MTRCWKVGIMIGALSAIGCSGPRPRDATKKPPISDATACARLCDDLLACGGAPGRCVATCEEDRARLRPGFEASFVTCVDRELVPPACSTSPTVAGDAKARSEKISLCFSATLTAYEGEDAGRSLARVLVSICRRSVRCGNAATGNAATSDAAVGDATVGKEDACVAELTALAMDGAVGKLLAAARDDLVGKIAACVEGRVCSESDPVAPCLKASE